MGERTAEEFDDLLQLLRSLGWTATMHQDADHLQLELHHPLQDVDVNADTPEEMRRMLHQLFAPDGAFMQALREAARGSAEDLSVIGDTIRACRPFASSPRLPSAVLGVMADRAFIDDASYEWFREHAEAVVKWPG